MKITELNEKLKKVKLLAMDVDGTLTDGSLFIPKPGDYETFLCKRWDGITLLNKAGIKQAR
jgi:3-deoxy-D-manno-octulosonate 8-phosphate phosphatase KdsC-like HAD superfamily phosphatase